MGTTKKLESPRPHDPTSDLRVSGDVLTTNGEGAPDPVDDLVDRVIGGRYRIRGVLGRGGMGVVYRATHLELDQEVAVKVLPASFARDAETLKRFEREARTASRVRHPNVVTVFDLGRLDTGEPYLVMELLEGRDLEALFEERGTLALPEVVRILEPVATAIDALHLEGVVHRDIKPSNIFFAKTKAMGEVVKLVDFGLAAVHRTEGTERLTRVGHVVGTAVYMAPEAARGELSGPAGDVYALAVVAFELLTGLAPFDGQPMAVLLDKVSQPAPSLAQATGRPFPASVEAAFATALQRDPRQRHPTALAFVDALRAALRDESSMPPAGVRSRPPPRAPDAATESSPAPRLASRAPWIGGALALLLALSLTGWWATRVPEAGPTTPATSPLAPPPSSLVIEPPPDDPPLAGEPSAPAPAPEPAPAPTASLVRPGRVEHAPRATFAVHQATATAPPVTTTSPPPPPVTTLEAPTTPAPEAPTAPEISSSDRTAELLRQAQSAMLRGQIPTARSLYEQATEASPRAAAAWRGLGLASERLGLVPEARRAYVRYLELAPDARDAPTVQERLDHLAP